MALTRAIILFILSITSSLSFGQSTDFRYDFFYAQMLSLKPNVVIIAKDGSSKIYELFIDREKGFDPRSCLFNDNKYYSESVWDTIFTEKDTDFIYEQINRYRKF